MADTAAPPTEAAPPAPGGFKAKLPLIALVAVGLAIGGGTGAKLVGPMMAKKMGRGAAPAATEAAAPEAADHGAEPEAPADGKGKEGANGAPSVHLLENLVLNPAGSGGSRFLLLSVAIETGGANTVTEFQARDAELRDIILTALGSKTVDQLTDISTREGIKTELLAAIGARFGKGVVKRLYFPQFVVQ
jgi:flagellar FliL protein